MSAISVLKVGEVHQRDLGPDSASAGVYTSRRSAGGQSHVGEVLLHAAMPACVHARAQSGDGHGQKQRGEQVTVASEKKWGGFKLGVHCSFLACLWRPPAPSAQCVCVCGGGG